MKITLFTVLLLLAAPSHAATITHRFAATLESITFHHVKGYARDAVEGDPMVVNDVTMTAYGPDTPYGFDVRYMDLFGAGPLDTWFTYDSADSHHRVPCIVGAFDCSLYTYGSSTSDVAGVQSLLLGGSLAHLEFKQGPGGGMFSLYHDDTFQSDQTSPVSAWGLGYSANFVIAPLVPHMPLSASGLFLGVLMAALLGAQSIRQAMRRRPAAEAVPGRRTG